MRRLLLLPLLLLCLGQLFTSCSVTRYVPEDEHLLNRTRLIVDDETSDINLPQLRNYIRQTPNARWFSLFRLPLATYSLSGRDTTRWLNKTLRNIGEAPVLYDSVQARHTCADLQQQLRNEGFLNSRVLFLK